jgi:ABC-type antimicrobial peptide transport system permease subunit
MKKGPPKIANRFLQWYCRPELLEEIQGDVYEIYYREVKENKRKAGWKFIWNVIRFFRWRNIRRRKKENLKYSTSMLQNIFKVAVRNFFRQPGHSFLNVMGLAVSFIAAFLIGLWIFHELSFDRFHLDSDRIFKVMSHVDANGTIETYSAARVNINLAAIPDVTEKTVVITGTRWPNELCFRPDGKPNECIYLFGVFAEQPFFSIFNFPIIKGDQNPLANPSNIAISESMAQKLYGDVDPLGKIIKIDDHYPVTIASVFQDVPSNSSLQFQFILPIQVFARMRGFSDDYFNRDFQTVYFKTSTDISGEVLTTMLNEPDIRTEDLKKDRLSYSAFSFVDTRLRSEFVNGKNSGGRVQYVNLFTLIAILVVAMAVINFVNLSTARASNRSKEIGIRKVTGALRSGIVMQFVGESFLVVVIALAMALLSTQLLLPAFNNLIGEALSVSLLNPSIVGWVAAFALVVSLAAGLYPAWVMSAFQPAKVLKGNTVTASTGAQHLRKILLVVQVSVSVGIIIFTGVLFQQLSFVREKNLGLDSQNMLHIEPTYNLLKQYNAFKNELLNHPEIENVTASNADPINLTVQTTGVSWPGMPDGKNASFKLLGGNHEMAQAFGLTLTAGRMFKNTSSGKKEMTLSLNTDSTKQEVIVTERAVREMELKEPIGTEIGIGNAKFTIIGVVKDFHTESLKQEQLPVILYVHDILNCSRLYVKYREGATASALEIIENTYKKFEPAFTMKYDFMDEAFDKMYKTENTASTMLVFFTGIALLIAVIGVVGLATYNVVRRKKEIGIKRVFGASVIQILGNLSKEFIWLITFATLLATPAVWYVSDRWLQSFAYRINMPWWIYAVTLVTIVLLTILLIVLQGLKTVRTNPTETLRSE